MSGGYTEDKKPVVASDDSLALIKAAASNDCDAMQVLLASPGIDVNYAPEANPMTGDGETALIQAVRWNNMEAVKLLLAHPNIDVNAVDSVDRRTPLWMAVMRNNVEMFDLLLQVDGIDINKGGYPEELEPPLQMAVSTMCEGGYNRPDALVEGLLARPEIDVNIVLREKRSLLMSAISDRGEHDKAWMPKLLQMPGIDLNYCNGSDTALSVAYDRGNGTMMKQILETPGIDVNLQNEKGRTALMMALLERIGMSEKDRKLQNFKALLNAPNLNVNMKDNFGSTALMMAVKQRYDPEFLEALMEHPDVDYLEPRDDPEKQAWKVSNICTSALRKATEKQEKEEKRKLKESRGKITQTLEYCEGKDMEYIDKKMTEFREEQGISLDDWDMDVKTADGSDPGEGCVQKPEVWPITITYS